MALRDVTTSGTYLAPALVSPTGGGGAVTLADVAQAAFVSGLAEATAAQVRAGTAAVAVSPSVLFGAMAPVALTSGATVAVDMNSGLIFSLTLGHNAAMSTPTNQKVGQAGEFWIFQGAGAYTLDWAAEYVFIGGEPVIPTTNGDVCVVAYRVMASNVIRCVANTGAVSVSYTNEEAQDAVGTILVDSSSIDFTYTDATPAITASVIFGTGAGVAAEGNHTHAQLHDAVTLAGTPDYITLSGQVLTRNSVDLAADVAGNLPVANLGSGTGASATTFWRGDGSWATPSGVGGYTDEEAQDAVGLILTDSTSINFTYTDATPEITAAAIFGTSAGTVAEGNHNHDAAYISVVVTPTAGNFPVLTAGGELDNSTYSNASFATAAQGTLAGTALQPADVGTIATQAASNVAITGGSITGITDLAIADGGTGSSTAAGAFTNLKQAATTTATGVVELATDGETASGVAVQGNDSRLHSAVTLAGTPDYITLAGQVITLGLVDLTTDVSGDLPIADGGTGASTAAAAFTALKQNATDTATGVVELATAAEVVTGTDTTRAVTAAGAAARYQPIRSVVTESGATHTNAASDRDKWIRFTGTGAKTYTISSGVAATGDIWAFYNAGATGNLSVAASGTTLTGNLVFAPLKAGFIFFTSSSAADVVGGSAT